MATQIAQLSQSALTATLTTTLYTVPAATTAIVKEVLIANTDSAARTVTIRAGGSGVANTLIPTVSVPANTSVVFSLSTVLPTGTVISGGASVGSVVGVTISGVLST